VNLSKGRIEKTIALLSLESPAPIARQGPKWQLTAASFSQAFWQRAERLTALRYDEQLREYVNLTSGTWNSLSGRWTSIRARSAGPHWHCCRRPRTRRSFKRRRHSCAAPACRLIRASNGRPAGCHSFDSAGGFHQRYRPGLAEHSASGVTPDGVISSVGASTVTDTSPTNWSTRVPRLCASGIPSPL
jgi:hypothetical protein